MATPDVPPDEAAALVAPAEHPPEQVQMAPGSAYDDTAPVPPPLPEPAEAPASFVYALGQLDARFPSLAVEQEVAQVAGTLDAAGLTSRHVLKQVISERRNRYLARSLCWILTIEGLETYIVVPRDPGDLDLLIEGYREEPSGNDVDVVIGVRGPIAPPEMCNGLALPIVVLDQLYSFEREGLVESIPPPQSLTKREQESFPGIARDMFESLIQIADNAGAIDEHRALNYLAVRYPRIYTVAAEKLGRNVAFSGVEVVRSPLSGLRTVVDVVFTYTNRQTDVVERESVRVDVTEEFPFLVRKLAPYFPAEIPGSLA